ncbi:MULTISPECIES: DUF1109 domain-containing protein [Alphaproteobacteria]|jgi:hypothetical protein|uniref:Membrane protein n=1 Tax=Maricaulis virginensis TaxID=144022 RepID=A0A9W6MQ65_9PROT|nr:DUF1109 domain-containing protein [Maricaulis virginensis]GLK53938.1 membrane protein [Maricaulis virginensis]
MTDPLIESLAADLEPVKPRRYGRWLAVGAAAGLIAGALAFWLLPGIQVRPDIAIAVLDVPFWIKLVFTGLLAATGCLSLIRLVRPGGRAAAALWLPCVLWIGFALMAAADLAMHPVDVWPERILGSTALRCVTYIVLISLPILAVLALVARRGAPTRLTQAGWALGLAAGGIAATIYALGCPEASPAFLTVWYALGIGLTAAASAVAGRYFLRW